MDAYHFETVRLVVDSTWTLERAYLLDLPFVFCRLINQVILEVLILGVQLINDLENGCQGWKSKDTASVA